LKFILDLFCLGGLSLPLRSRPGIQGRSPVVFSGSMSDKQPEVHQLRRTGLLVFAGQDGKPHQREVVSPTTEWSAWESRGSRPSGDS
jgi:hypothetical protein